MSMANIHWLPVEMRVKIYDLLPFETRKTLRSVDPLIRNEIDDLAKFAFNVELSDETIDFVENVTFPRIDTLRVENFTKMINSTNIPSIHTVIFGKGISSVGLGHMLTLCNETTVEKLKFGHSFIVANENELEFGHYVLPHVKTMEIMLGTNEDLVNDWTNWNGQKSAPRHDHGSGSRKLFDLLKNHVTLPSLEKIDILVDLNLTNVIPFGDPPAFFAQHIFSRIYDYVNGLRGIKYLGLNLSANLKGGSLADFDDDLRVKIDGISLDCSELEELALVLKLDPYYTAGSPHKIGCKMLKKLKVEHFSDSESAMIRDLITNNSNTLESIFLKSSNLPLSCINLQICSNLKELTLRTKDLVEFSNGTPFPPEFNMERTLGRLNLEIELGRHTEDEFRILQRIFERIPNGVQEFRFKPHKYLGMTRLKWILAIPNLKKLILVEIEPGEAEFMARRCRIQIPGIYCSVTSPAVFRRNLGMPKSNLCIQK